MFLQEILIREELQVLRQELKHIKEEIMSALDDLNAAIAKLSEDVTAEVAALADAISKQSGTPDADVEAAVANLQALSAQLEASVTPAAPVETPSS